MCFTLSAVFSTQFTQIMYNSGNITSVQGTGFPHIFLPLKGPHLQYYSLLIFLRLNCQFHILLAGYDLWVTARYITFYCPAMEKRCDRALIGDRQWHSFTWQGAQSMHGRLIGIIFKQGAFISELHWPQLQQLFIWMGIKRQQPVAVNQF